MNLIIDIGNTKVKITVFNSNKILNFSSIHPDNTIEEIHKIINKYKVTHSLISVVGKKNTILEKILRENNIFFHYLSNELKLPFTINYKTPSFLGADRIALVAGAVYNNPKKNNLIIDAGTCITYDFIDNNNIYHGGAISPGIDLRFKSLNDYTANLPFINSISNDIGIIGNSTKTSIESGVILGIANEIEGFIVKYNLKYSNLTVFLTGGSQKILDRYIKNKIFVNSKYILFEGMNLILNMNK